MLKMVAKIKYSDIQLGAGYEFEKKLTQRDVLKFAELTGDFNPLHVDRRFGNESIFGKNIIHGMLVGSLFSTLVGMYYPGEKNLYISQTLQFKKPVYPNETIKVRSTVVGKNDSVKLITIRTDILKNEEILITGTAVVRVLE